jgi:demethylmenaquinone methyltransferase/2-methoxy-6-polyprenyl-1,4-benzoquinol methylase
MSEARGTFQPASVVREMFDRVAPRYDLLNHLLSLNIDRLWRSAVAREFRDVLSRADARALDLCCGTGDLTLALHEKGPAQVIGADFCHPMLVRAAAKLAAVRRPPPVLEADALQLPFPDSSFDLVTMAFGFRNLADYDGGLREMFRSLRPGGRVGILEFSEVTGLLGPLYRFYFSQILPRLGALISNHSGAYLYLPASVERFLSPEELAARMRAAGFEAVSHRRFTFGIACLHVGTRAMV